jgi:hypothetical protein
MYYLIAQSTSAHETLWSIFELPSLRLQTIETLHCSCPGTKHVRFQHMLAGGDLWTDRLVGVDLRAA